MSFEIRTSDRSPLKPEHELDLRNAVRQQWAEALALLDRPARVDAPGCAADVAFAAWLGASERSDMAGVSKMRQAYAMAFYYWLCGGEPTEEMAQVLSVGFCLGGGYFVDPGRSLEIADVIRPALAYPQLLSEREGYPAMSMAERGELDVLYIFAPGRMN